MAKRSKEEKEEERKKELLRTLRRGPDLDRFIDEQKRTFVSYALPQLSCWELMDKRERETNG